MTRQNPGMPADITLVNLNMLYVRYADGRKEREKHLPLGTLYLATALEAAGFTVDFRDYQTHECLDPFLPESINSFLENSAPILGVSCMANLLPFTLLALRDFKKRNPDKTVVLGGVGSKSVERLTGHELLRGARCDLPGEHARIFEFVSAHPDIFPGFFHCDLQGNVLPKLKVLQEFGFYGPDRTEVADTDSCGAHSPRVKMARPDAPAPIELATRAV